MNSLSLKSPAKLNLYLKVIGKLPSGYHELVTLFHRISLCDTIHIQKTSKPFQLMCSSKKLSCGEDNLITQSYRLLQKKIPGLSGVRVHLKKRIPMGGGLGGGSSNAAFFLLGMKRLFKLKISKKDLLAMGKKLGADVPFFLYEVNQAIGKGIGDRIVPQLCRRRQNFVLVLSPESLSTPQVYRKLPSLPQASLTKIGRVVRILAGKLDRGGDFQSKRLLHNDLELSAFSLRPSIQEIISTLHHLGIKTAGMSGSGPSVFAIFPSQDQARKMARKIKRIVPAGHKILVCRTY